MTRIINYKIGIDIENISRFSKKQIKSNKNFYKKIFTDEEIAYCLSKKNPYQHFAARFCAKEAAIKAIGKRVSLKKIKILNENQTPVIILPNRIIGDVSLSHTNDIAIAVVIIETKNGKK